MRSLFQALLFASCRRGSGVAVHGQTGPYLGRPVYSLWVIDELRAAGAPDRLQQQLIAVRSRDRSTEPSCERTRSNSRAKCCGRMASSLRREYRQAPSRGPPRCRCVGCSGAVSVGRKLPSLRPRGGTAFSLLAGQGPCKSTRRAARAPGLTAEGRASCSMAWASGQACVRWCAHRATCRSAWYF